MSDAEDVRRLMEADRWLERVAGQRRSLPEEGELASVESELRVLAESLRRANSELEPVRRAYEESMAEDARLERRAQELEARLSSSVGPARDLGAIHREFEQVKERRSDLEDQELDLLMQLEPLEADVALVKSQATPVAARRAELRTQLEALHQSLDEEIGALREARSEAANHVRDALRTRYETALSRAGISGAAQLVNARCDGCRLVLAPLDVERVKAVEDGEFASCPECGRILLP